MGIVRPSASSWPSPLHMVPKRTPGDWHPCGDFRALNKVNKMSLTDILSLMYTTLLPPSEEQLFSHISICNVFITRSQLPLVMCRKPWSQYLLGYLNFFICRFGSQTFQLFYTTVAGTVMICSSPVPTMNNTFSTYRQYFKASPIMASWSIYPRVFLVYPH